MRIQKRSTRKYLLFQRIFQSNINSIIDNSPSFVSRFLRKFIAPNSVAVFLLLGAGLLIVAPNVKAKTRTYEPNWKSIDSRPIPDWYDDAKFGIFVHWGVYSVPAWGPKDQYAEWYWKRIEDQRAANNPFWQFHQKTYGADAKYQSFAPQFRAEMFEPEKWADLFKRAGARYVVLTSKHHDGFALWPSPQSWNWNSADVGPHRDLAGDLSKAVKQRNLKMGFYYSLYEWFHPLYKSDVKRYVAEHMTPQIKDLVTRYDPAILWTDGEWEHTEEVWRSEEFLAWLYNNAPNKDEVVVNDRWGKHTRSKHGGFFTTEYGKVHLNTGDALDVNRKWEECRGMGHSFGYNRNEDASDYKTSTELVQMLVTLVARGGNLLLNVGPTADGRIPAIMQDRLLEIGKWLDTNGEAIYDTKPWRVASETERIFYTQKGADVYVISFNYPKNELVLKTPKTNQKTTVTMLGTNNQPLKSIYRDGAMYITVPVLTVDELPSRHAFVFKLSNVE